MIVVFYAVCSEQAHKPVTRGVRDTRQEAERLLEVIRREDGNDPTVSYWIAELSPECQVWRSLVPELGNQAPAREE